MEWVVGIDGCHHSHRYINWHNRVHWLRSLTFTICANRAGAASAIVVGLTSCRTNICHTLVIYTKLTLRISTAIIGSFTCIGTTSGFGTAFVVHAERTGLHSRAGAVLRFLTRCFTSFWGFGAASVIHAERTSFHARTSTIRWLFAVTSAFLIWAIIDT